MLGLETVRPRSSLPPRNHNRQSGISRNIMPCNVCMSSRLRSGCAGEVVADLRVHAHVPPCLFGSEKARDDLRQHRVDGERVVGGVRHDRELVCGPQ